ncbi:MAG TPA: hypothetical protein VEC11_12305 [Allosphingosinicella sp.]|nr:hypothetical protein [Allosphingosinicella sp.]
MQILLFTAALALALQDDKPDALPAPAAAEQAEPEGDGANGTELPEGSANLDFVMLNRTGQTIVELNISPAGEESWSDNLLHYPEVPDQERAAASYARDVELCRWDIRVRFPSGQRRSWPAVNLCDTVRVELR